MLSYRALTHVVLAALARPEEDLVAQTLHHIAEQIDRHVNDAQTNARRTARGATTYRVRFYTIVEVGA